MIDFTGAGGRTIEERTVGQAPVLGRPVDYFKELTRRKNCVDSCYKMKKTLARFFENMAEVRPKPDSERRSIAVFVLRLVLERRS